MFAGVFWEAQDLVIADIGRIEVVRGPGGTLWGANAVNGVIHVIMKNAADTRGTFINTAAGSHALGPFAVRHGGRFATAGSYRVYGKVRSHDAADLLAGGSAGNHHTFGQAGFRIESDRGGHHFGGSPDRLELVTQLMQGRNPGSLLYLREDLDALDARLETQGAAVFLIVLAGMALSFLLSYVLERAVGRPIVALAGTARDIAERGDYSIRAARTTRDEVGLLVDAFNSMLDEIERSQRERADLLEREQEANRLKDEFLATLSHELRTPLNAICRLGPPVADGSASRGGTEACARSHRSQCAGAGAAGAGPA